MLHKRSLSPVCKSVISLKTLSASLTVIFFTSLQQMQRKRVCRFLWISKGKGERKGSTSTILQLREILKKDPMVCFAKLLTVPWPEQWGRRLEQINVYTDRADQGTDVQTVDAIAASCDSFNCLQVTAFRKKIKRKKEGVDLSCSSPQPVQHRRDLMLPFHNPVCANFNNIFESKVITFFSHTTPRPRSSVILFIRCLGYIFFRNVLSFSCLISSPVFLFSLHCSALCPIDHCFPSVICLATIISELFISIKSECQCQTRLPASCFDEELLQSENSGPSARSHSNECWRKVDYWVKDKITEQASWSCQSILGCLCVSLITRAKISYEWEIMLSFSNSHPVLTHMDISKDPQVQNNLSQVQILHF